MKLLLDVNVLLDVALAREPWVREAAPLLSAIESGRAEGHVAGHGVTTLHHIVARQRGRDAARSATSDLLRIVHVVPLNDADFQQALLLDFSDFEDAVQAAAALRVGADFVVTRDRAGFARSPVPVRAPGELLALL